ncbi:MAG: type II toxin-antitoxin system HipA family toxin [Pseudomonadota bacterium]
MARRKTYPRLNVLMNGRMVGVLNRASSGAVDFSYDQEWLGWEHAIPVSRSLPLREDRYIGAPVLAVFENLLPDNDAIRTKVAERTSADGIDAYSLLSQVGRDCVGALQFVPDGFDPGDISKVQGEPLDEAGIARILRNLESAPLGLDDDDEFRISLAGAQEKTALLFHEGKWKKPLGATPTTHILKTPIGELQTSTGAILDLSESVANEFLCMRLTAALGLPTAHVEMARFEDQSALVVERFDRQWTKDNRLLRKPQEDMCQALSVPPTKKYETDGGPGMADIFALLKESDTPYNDQLFFLKSQIAFWMLGATDGHAKNFSIFLKPGGRFSITPLYDVLSVTPCYAAGQIQKNKIKLAMAVGENRRRVLDQIAQRHFEQTVKLVGPSDGMCEQAIEELRSAIPKAIETVVSELADDFPAWISDPLFEALRKQS